MRRNLGNVFKGYNNSVPGNSGFTLPARTMGSKNRINRCQKFRIFLSHMLFAIGLGLTWTGSTQLFYNFNHSYTTVSTAFTTKMYPLATFQTITRSSVDAIVASPSSPEFYAPSLVAIIYCTAFLITISIIFLSLYLYSSVPIRPPHGIVSSIVSSKYLPDSKSTGNNLIKNDIVPTYYTKYPKGIITFREILKSVMTNTFGLIISVEEVSITASESSGTFRKLKIMGKRKAIGKLSLCSFIWGTALYLYCFTAFAFLPSEFTAIYASNLSFTYTFYWVLLHEKFLAHKILAMVCFLASIILVTHYRGQFLNYLGNVFLCALSSILYSIFKVNLKRAMNQNNSSLNSHHSFPPPTNYLIQSQNHIQNNNNFENVVNQPLTPNGTLSFSNTNLSIKNTPLKINNNFLLKQPIVPSTQRLLSKSTTIAQSAEGGKQGENNSENPQNQFLGTPLRSDVLFGLNESSTILSPSSTLKTNLTQSNPDYMNRLELKIKDVSPINSPTSPEKPHVLFDKSFFGKFGVRLTRRVFFYITLCLGSLLLLWPFALIFHFTKVENVPWKIFPWRFMAVIAILHTIYMVLYEFGSIILNNDFAETFGIFIGVLLNTVIDLYLGRILLNRMLQIAMSFNMLGFLLLMLPRKWHIYTGKVIKVKRISATNINSVGGTVSGTPNLSGAMMQGTTTFNKRPSMSFGGINVQNSHHHQVNQNKTTRKHGDRDG